MQLKKVLVSVLATVLVGTTFSMVSTIDASAVDTTYLTSTTEDGAFSYMINTYTNSAIIATYNGSDTDVVIPDTIDGYPVTVIADKAFESNRTIESVVIPDTVTTIGSSAFYECYSLESVTVPSSLVTIDSYAFYNTNITSFDFPYGLTTIGKYAFCGCGLEKIILPNSVTSIGSYCFSGCGKATILKISDSMTEIPSEAFQECKSLEEVILPRSVEYIHNAAFFNCTAITDVYYIGTERDWRGILGLENGYFNQYLSKATKHYNYVYVDENDPATTDTNTTVTTEVTTTTDTNDATTTTTDTTSTERYNNAINGVYGDVNGDGDVNAVDLLIIKKIVLGINTD